MKAFIIVACCIGIILSLAAIGVVIVCLIKEVTDYMNDK